MNCWYRPPTNRPFSITQRTTIEITHVEFPKIAQKFTFGVSFLRYQLQDDRFHRRDITKPHLRYVQSANHMRPALCVGALQCPIPRWAQFASDARRPFLALAFPAEPRARGHRHNAVARLVHGHRTILTIAVDERILRPSTLVGAYTTTTDHLLHFCRPASGIAYTKRSRKVHKIETASVWMLTESRVFLIAPSSIISNFIQWRI